MGAVYRKELSANARKLIEQLLSLPQGWVTAAALAESIGVSRRTVLRSCPLWSSGCRLPGRILCGIPARVCCWMKRRSGETHCAPS